MLSPRSARWILPLALALSVLAAGCSDSGGRRRTPVPDISLEDQHTVQVGRTLQFTVSLQDASDENVMLAVSPVPLPERAQFDVESGRFSWSPSLDQVGTHDFVFSARNESGGETERRTRVAVTARSATGGGQLTTDLAGFVHDSGTRDSPLPIQGVSIRMAGLGGADILTSTDASGRFELRDVDPTAETIFIDGTASGYAFVAEDVMLLTGHPLYVGQENLIQRPIYLPALGAPVGEIVAGQTTVIYNSALNIELTITANSARLPDGTLYTGPIFMPEVPADRTPAALPSNMRPGLVIAIQPAGLTFNPVATLRWPNIDDLEPGTTADLWSVDATSGEFDDVGDLTVSTDGVVLTTTSGGVRNSSWHFPSPGPGDGTGDTGDSNDQNQDCQNQCKAPAGSRVALQTGSLVVEHQLAGYRSLGQDRSLMLVYNSHTASPKPAVNADLFIPPGTAVPDTFSSRFSVAGVRQPFEVFTEPSARDTVRVACVFDARTFPTGWYTHSLDLWSNYQRSSIATTVLGGSLVNNESNSPYGCGWSLAGIQQIRPVPGTNRVTLTEGDGSIKLFTPQSTTQVIQATDLCFAIDGSGSISGSNFTLMKDGIASAIENPSIIPQDGSISIGVVQFPRGSANPEVALTRIDSAAAAASLAQRVRAIRQTGGGTPMDQGINDATNMLVLGLGIRQVICLATDGQPNDQLATIAAADEAVRRGVEELDAIAIGPGASVAFLQTIVRNGFVESAATFQTFASTVGQKLQRVVSGAPPGEYSTVFVEPDGSYRREMVDKTSYFFDPSGLMTRSVDRNGNATVYTYGSSGGLVSMTDPVGLQTTFNYSGAGKLAEVVLPDGRRTRLNHDGRGALTNVIDPDGADRRFEYDPRGKLTRQFNQRGFQTDYRYDATGRLMESTEVASGMMRRASASETAAVVSAPSSTSALRPASSVLSADVRSVFTDPEGNETEVRAHRLGQPLLVRDSLGRETRFERDIHGNPTRSFAANGRRDEGEFDTATGQATLVRQGATSSLQRQESYEYHPDFGFVTKHTDPAGNETLYEYDTAGNLTKITNPLGGERVFTYTATGLVATSTDENGNVTTFTYDVRGDLETATDALGFVTRYQRNSSGSVTAIIEGVGTPEQRAQSFTYDAMQRVTSSTDGAGGVTRFEYDRAGNLTRTVLPTGESIAREYDSMGRLTRLVDPLRGETVFTYDLRGNLRSRRDALGRTTSFDYDEENQLVLVTDPQGGVERYTYDASGNVETFRNASGNTTRFAYDALDRRTRMVTPQGRVRQWNYDTRDNLVAEVQPGNVTVQHSYDVLGRRSSTTVPAVGGAPGNSIVFTYDAVGNLRTVSDNDTQLERTYDALNRVRDEMTLAGGLQPVTTLTSSYNAVGDRTTLADSEGGMHTYGHDNAGRLSSVATPPVGTISLSYDLSGRLRGVNYPNGLTGRYDYLASGRLSRITHGGGGRPSVVALSYQTGASGNIDGINDSGVQKNYGYDPLDRLTAASEIAPAAYAYDQVGNRTQSDSTARAAYNDDNQLLSDDIGTYQYDARGNLLRFIDGLGGAMSQDYVWEAQNQLVEATGVSSYRYDGLGRRVEKVTPSGTRRYVYDGDNILLEFDGTNALVARYTHGEQVDQHLAMVRGGAAFYYHADHLGSVRSVTDGAGAEANRYRYDPYGRVVERVEAVENPYWYTGREDASEIGWYFYRARWYKADTGGFTGEDPSRYRSGDVNWYRYVGNDPINWVDPDGLQRTYGDCAGSCVRQHLGLTAAGGASGVAAIPIPKRFAGVPVIGNSSRTTNIISLLGHRLLPNFRVPVRVLGTTRVFGILGRLNPYVAAGLAVVDAVLIGRCIAECRSQPCDPCEGR